MLRLLFSVLLMIWVAITPAFAQATSSQATIVYQSLQADLDRSGVPLRLPRTIISPAVDSQFGYGTTLGFASSDGYSLTVGNRTPCYGTPCALAYVEAIQIVPGVPEIPALFTVSSDDPNDQPVRSQESATWINLSGGQHAYFSPWQSFLGPGYSHLTWDEGDYRYDLSLKVGNKADLIAMAESM